MIWMTHWAMWDMTRKANCLLVSFSSVDPFFDPAWGSTLEISYYEFKVLRNLMILRSIWCLPHNDNIVHCTGHVLILCTQDLSLFVIMLVSPSDCQFLHGHHYVQFISEDILFGNSLLPLVLFVFEYHYKFVSSC